MDLPKFVWLLTQNKLAMPRLDRLADQHEGSLTPKTLEWIDRFLRTHKAKDGIEVISDSFRKSRKTTFVSCWHANEHESEAMWRLYCGDSSGVALQTTYSHLIQAITSELDVYIGCVKYIDYDSEWFPEANMYAPAMHKRIAFAHEREVRLVSSPSRLRLLAEADIPTSLTIPWNCEALVEQVHVSPYAPEYFYEAVQSVIRSIAPDLESKLKWSYMKAAPVF